MEEEPLQPSRFRSLEDAVEIAGGHGVAAVGHAPGIDLGQNLLRVADCGDGAARFFLHHLVEKRLRKSQLHVG